jgi:hypothetical protein
MPAGGLDGLLTLLTDDVEIHNPLANAAHGLDTARDSLAAND